MDNWKEYLLYSAEKSKMCSPYREALSGCNDKESAIRLYKTEVDWALLNGYPSLDFLRKEFSGFEKSGVFIDHVFAREVFKKQQCYVFHHCTGEILVDIDLEKAVIPMLYVANGSHLVIKRADVEDKFPIIVPVYVFGSSSVVAESTENVTFRVFWKEK